MIEKYRNEIQQVIGKKKLLEEQHKKILENLDNSKSKLLCIEESQKIIQSIAKATQENIKIHMENIIQKALDSCFNKEYKFIIDFVAKRGKTEVKLYFIKNEEKINPLDAVGGGVIDIITFALRIAIWNFSGGSDTLIFDEQFKHLSDNMKSIISELMKEISKELNVQIIMATHADSLSSKSDRIIVVKKKNDISIVE